MAEWLNLVGEPLKPTKILEGGLAEAIYSGYAIYSVTAAIFVGILFLYIFKLFDR
jgi:hypothetical protein